MLKSCSCPFCVEPERPIYSHSDEALWWLVQTRDDIHDKRKRVYAYIHLFYRAGVFDPMMPYRVWITVMGTEEDPPFATAETKHLGAFQPQRQPDGTPHDMSWTWCEIVGKKMPWSELN